MYTCKRCGIYFEQKGTLRNHLKRKMMCMAIESEISPAELLDELEIIKGIECKDCKKTYKNAESLRKHKCKIVKSVDNNEIEKLKKMFDAKIKELEKKIETNQPTNITNNITNNNSITNNIVVINCIDHPSNQPIQYLLDKPDITEFIMGLISRGIDGLLGFIEEKFFNDEHPENNMIRISEDKKKLELHMRSGWRSFEKKNGIGWILMNVGNDFGVFFEILKELDDYKKLVKGLKRFEKDIIKPLEWGYDINSNEEVTKTMTQLEDGTTVFKEDIEEEEHNEKMKEHIQEKTTKLVENKGKS
jgi:hypothetical protein